MTVATINTSDEHSQYIGQVYQEYNARLRHYFLIQLDNIAEAEACVQETIRCFFFFMEDRCWERDVKYMTVYLMRIAGFLCSRRLAEKSMQRTAALEAYENNRLFNKIKNEVAQTFNGLAAFGQLLLRPAEGNNA